MSLSPGQERALERLEARFPATHFTLAGQDRYSCAAHVEVEDLATCMEVFITADGLVRDPNELTPIVPPQVCGGTGEHDFQAIDSCDECDPDHEGNQHG